MASILSKPPSWLYMPPETEVSPPVETRIQELPFEGLGWKNFERLCLRLVETEADVEHCQLYGVQGQDQGRIDIYARRRHGGSYAVYQCKRVSNFGPLHIEEAFNSFLEGDWVESADTFVLCTQESLERTERAVAVEQQSAVLQTKGVTLKCWDSGKLSSKFFLVYLIPTVGLPYPGGDEAQSRNLR
jgi:hypothetical protein